MKLYNTNEKLCKRIQSKIGPYYYLDHLFSIKNEKKSYNKNESNILTLDMPYLNAHVYALTKQTIADRS